MRDVNGEKPMRTTALERRKAMRPSNLLMIGVLLVAGVQFSACKHSPASAKAHAEHPAEVKRIDGTELSRVTLTEKAIQRLGLKTDQVREDKVARKTPMAGERKVVPYSSLIYDAQGQTWIYTSPSARTFVRHKVEVDHIEGDVAVLKDGPPMGTVVASVGVAELYGTEFKVGH
jgi:outer membrane receptor for ferric coprogen and ferric-rhodotorulic acid